MLIPNSFQTPNIIVDEVLPYLQGSETKVVLFLIRKTFGWHKKQDKISLSQFEKGTGLSRQSIIDSLNFLCDLNLVLKYETQKGSTNSFELNIDWNLEQNKSSLKNRPVKKLDQCSQKIRPEVVQKLDTQKHSKPTILNQYILSNVCPNCKSKIRVKKKKNNSEYENTIYCDKCHCEFVLNENSDIEYLNKGTDYEAMECYDKYFELHPNSEDMIYEKPVALKMFQSILKRCKNSGANGEAKEIVFERLENYFNNEFYEKVNWSIETFSKNFNTFTTKHQVTTTNLPYLN